MHLALKSAMSRIPYTNKVGETLGSIADSAAAYSLRALGGGDPMVARVRRSSDDAEKDFTASDMGAALENWVNGDVVITNSTFTNISGTYDTFSGASSSGFTATNTASDGRALSNVTISTPQIGDKFRINYNLTLNSGNAILFAFATSTGASASTGFTVYASGTGSIELTATKTDIASLRVNAIGNVDFVLSDVSITAIQSSGFVTTWYDQSGNDNHATQGTAGSQPKIVDSGAYLGELDFDGVDDQLDYPLSISTLNNTSSFVLAAFQNTTDNQFVLTVSGGSNNRWYSPIIWNGSYRFGYGASIDSINLGTPDENNHLFTATAGSTTAEGFIDGLSKGTQPSTSNALSDQSFIGAHTSSISYPLNGSISEIIIYDSDQSSNRFKIESNINNHYDLYTNANDGHVATWYDQSGNDNHATQGTAGSQPKIVDSGVLVSDGIEFDGVDDYLGTSTFSLTQPYTTLSVSKSFINNDSGGLLSISTAPNGTTSLNSFYRNDNGIAINAGATLTTAPSFTYSTNTSYLKTSLFNGASSEISVNSISRASGNSGSIDPSGYLYLGNFSVYYLNGTISEIIIYNSDQSSNREAIETNINNHYDIY